MKTSRDAPKLRYRRVQEMIKEHTAKNQETKLDREVKDNLSKLTKLCQMKQDKFPNNNKNSSRVTSDGVGGKQLSHASSAVIRHSARNSDIHQVMPAATLTPRTGSKKSLAKTGKVDVGRHTNGGARSLETGKMS